MEKELDKKELREQAIRRLQDTRPAQITSEKDASKLIEELSIHQEELNIQNEELQRVQVELEASRAKYFELYDLAPVGYITLTPELIIKESNLTASIILGTERKNLINRGLSTYVSLGSHESLYLHYRRLSQEKEKQVNIFLVRSKDGKEIHIQFESNLVEEGSVGFRSILTDVTELKRAEESLKESESRYRSLFRDSSANMLLIDPATGDIVDSNQAACDYYGYSHENLVKMNIININTLGSEDVKKEMRRSVRGEKRKFDFRHRLANGEVRDVEVFSGPIYIHGKPLLHSIIHDVTNRKRFERELEETKALQEAIINQMPVGILVADARSGEILFANDEIEKMFGLGFKPTDIKGFIDYFRLARHHLDGRPYLTNEYPFVRSLTGERIRNELAEILRPDGSEVFINSSSAPVYDPYGNIVASVTLSIDVTEQVNIQKERDRLLADTEEYSKKLKRSNSELQQFAYVASHDLQEPLRMVVSYMSLLEKKYKDKLDINAQEYIHYAVDGGTRMRALIDDLLDYSRLDTQTRPFIPVDMNAIVAKTFIILKVQIEENNANIIVDPLPTVLADENQMVQLMQNLISNGIKFRGQERPEIHISASGGGKDWTFNVKDNGIGLNTANSDRMFQMFGRLHNKTEYPGTGIGLAIAKKIVERHGGRIWVESDGKNGSTFLFTIPKIKG